MDAGYSWEDGSEPASLSSLETFQPLQSSRKSNLTCQRHLSPLYSPGGNICAMNIVLKDPNEEINLNFVSVTPAGPQRHPLFTISVLGLILNVSRPMKSTRNLGQ